MMKIAGAPVKTRVPFQAWLVAALVTIFVLLSSLVPTAELTTMKPTYEKSADSAYLVRLSSEGWYAKVLGSSPRK
jgi:hypothetical protein